MSYNSRYTLTLSEVATPTRPLLTLDAKFVLKPLRERCTGAYNALEADGTTCMEIAWTTHRTDLRKFSRQHPTLLFHLHREGSDAGDLVDLYFVNGQHQECKAVVTYPPFDPTQLR